jgi:hypothetical protein
VRLFILYDVSDGSLVYCRPTLDAGKVLLWRMDESRWKSPNLRLFHRMEGKTWKLTHL